MKTLALDAMGVIYKVGDDVAELLRPFIAKHGGTADVALVQTMYREASLGRMPSAEFWRQVGLDPALENAYLDGVRLARGLRPFLRSVKPSVASIWCLSNDVSEWSRKLRDRFGLDRLLDGYVISGDVGARKPDPAIYRHLIAQVGAEPASIVFVDDRLPNLDAAAALGIESIYFGRITGAASKYPSAEQFHDLLDLVLRL